MHRFFVDVKQVKNQTTIYLEEPSDVKHLTRVLRAEVGEKIEICDSEGNEYICEIEALYKDQVVLEIIENRTIDRESPVEITLFQGLPKSDKMDLIVQKCVELGINFIVPVAMERSVAKVTDEKDAKKKTERWQKIADEAAKQSKRSAKVNVKEPVSFKNAIKTVEDYSLSLVPYELEQSIGIKTALLDFKVNHNIEKSLEAKVKIAIWIGPEGGISPKEIEALTELLAKPVTLGPRILRTETAGFAAVTAVQYELGDLGAY